MDTDRETVSIDAEKMLAVQSDNLHYVPMLRDTITPRDAAYVHFYEHRSMWLLDQQAARKRISMKVNKAEAVFRGLDRLDFYDEYKSELCRLLRQHQRNIKDAYTIPEAAELLSKADATVTVWCRNGQIKAFKQRPHGGGHKKWMISYAELKRTYKEGPLLVNDYTVLSRPSA